MKLFFGATIASIILFSCHSSGSVPASQNAPDSNAIYMPIKELIREDIAKVDSFAAGIQRISRVDSVAHHDYISLDDFKKLAYTLESALPDRQQLQEQFKETPLYDEASGELSLIYTPVNNSNRIQRMVAYVQSGEVRDVMKRLYLEESFQEKDSMVLRKITWKIGQYCSIVSSKNKNGQHGPIVVLKTIWDPMVFEEQKP